MWKQNSSMEADVSNEFQHYSVSNMLSKASSKQENQQPYRSIGGAVGAGLGALLLIFWFDAKEVSYLMLLIALFILIFFAAWLAQLRFVKLEVKSQHV